MSLKALLVSILIIVSLHFIYYPKWKEIRTEATLSWDVSGYYMYLPATFIYKDLKKCTFKDDILEKYNPTPNFQQAFIHPPSGNYVMKYSIGQAIIMSPYFAVAHLWASNNARYPADGFSLPYQFLISLGSLIIAIIGLIYLRKSLISYYDDKVVAITLLSLVIGTNYLNYSALDGAMTHNSLFTIYAILIHLSIQFHKKPSSLSAVGIGLCVGLAALTRPTEIISCLIPIFWGTNLLKLSAIWERIEFILAKWRLLAIAVIVTISVGFIQLIYWKYVSGEWIVYSYEDQGFSWLRPHFVDGVFSYKSGWFMYTPFMVFTILGFIPLYQKQKKVFFTAIIFFSLFFYITFAWDIWWYGGSIGQRAMVQSYPILAFPLAAFVAMLLKSNNRILQIVVCGLAALFIYTNLWFTHQAHKGGLFQSSQMNKAYYWKTLFTYEKNDEHKKLLDQVPEIYEGELLNKTTVFRDSSYYEMLNGEKQRTDTLSIPINDLSSLSQWMRISINAKIKQKEWTFWRMTHLMVDLKNEDELVTTYWIRMQRHMNDNGVKRIFMDIRKPTQKISAIEVSFWNGEGQKEIILNDIIVETFDEE